VPTTTPVALPALGRWCEEADVLHSRGEAGGTVSRASNFSTGMDSPVRLAWMMKQILARKQPKVAGIMSRPKAHDIARHQLGQRDFACWPPRITVAVTRINGLSAWPAAVPAFASWTKRKRHAQHHHMTMTTAARRSPVRADSTPSNDNR